MVCSNFQIKLKCSATNIITLAPFALSLWHNPLLSFLSYIFNDAESLPLYDILHM